NGQNKVFFPDDFDSLFIGDLNDSIITGTIDLHFSTLRDAISTDITWFNGNYNPLNYEFNEKKCYKNDSLWTGVDLKFKGYDENIATQGFGNYRIFYRKLNGTWDVCADNIVKPVIIIDGFDPGDERRILKRFKNGKTQPGIWDMLKFKDGGDFPVSQHLGDSLRSLGYDVIVLNFPEYPILETGINRDGGADYIERNAMVLVRLIQMVNAELALSNSEEELVIIGPSMGGQIARYALTYMEEQEDLGNPDMNHNTRLYVSFDSPHLGANIPLSLQRSIYALAFGLNHQDAKDSYNQQIRSVAARQMLIEQMGGLNKTSNFFINYYANLNLNGLSGNDGWPVNLRKVALINGVVDGTKTHSENQNIFDVEIKPLSMLRIQANSMPKYQNDSSPFYAKIQGRIMPNSDPSQLQLLLSTKATYTSQVNNSNRNGSMDVVPGGLYKTGLQLFQQLKDAVSKKKPATIHKHYLKETHTFIPSVSALAFKDRNFDWSDPINRNLICNNEIPFDNYFTAEENEEHIFISEKAAAWVLEEIEKGQPDCPTVCLSNALVENDLKTTLCIGEERYVFHNFEVPSSYNVTWYLEDTTTSVEIVDSDEYKVKIKGIEFDQYVPIYCKIENPCGADYVKKFILNEVGFMPGGLVVYPEEPVMIGQPPINNKAKIEFYEPELYDYYWKRGENGTWQEANSEHSPYTFTIQSNYDPNLPKLYLKSVNNCDEYVEEVYPWMQSAPLNKQIHLSEVKIQPNPSSSDWIVSFTNLNLKTIVLYDINGKKLWQSETQDLEIKVPGSNLRDGIYILEVHTEDAEKQSFKLLKQ
ncbi:MAG TPA: T9SS type A sorting domain-containing protein, partial [Chitinophagaceae bacterium]|nr:T9SS type A sorting domain-containing protein [Chitinophagaceae bacterium]